MPAATHTPGHANEVDALVLLLLFALSIASAATQRAGTLPTPGRSNRVMRTTHQLQEGTSGNKQPRLRSNAAASRQAGRNRAAPLPSDSLHGRPGGLHLAFVMHALLAGAAAPRVLRAAGAAGALAACCGGALVEHVQASEAGVAGGGRGAS